MRKLLVTLTLAIGPAIGHASLVLDDSPPATPAAPKATITPQYPSAEAALKAAQATPQSVPLVASTQTSTTAITSAPIVVNPAWEATPADKTLQDLFRRWGRLAGWRTFWEVNQDIPLIASSPFSGSFTDAVQAVLDTTLSTDLPAHPCFYTNHVMRVLPKSTECDPQ